MRLRWCWGITKLKCFIQYRKKAALGRLFYFLHSNHLIDMVVMTSMIIMKLLGWTMITETSGDLIIRHPSVAITIYNQKG